MHGPFPGGTHMSSQLPPLAALRVFEVAARHLSFTDAGKELFITQSAVSRQIRTLESFLGCKLFVRMTRRIELTDAGKQYLQSIQAAFQAIAKATTKVRNYKDPQRVTVNVLPTLATLWLMPRLGNFTQAYPDIELRLITSIHPVDFHSGTVDVALRVGRLPGKVYQKNQPHIELEMVESWAGVRAEPLFADVLVPVIARRLLSQGAPLETPKDLLHYRLINTSSRKHAWPDWLGLHKLNYEKFKETVDFGHFFIALQAARDCKGVAIVPLVLLQQCDFRHELQCPFEPGLESAGEYYLLTGKDAAEDRSLRLFCKWVQSEAAQIRELASKIIHEAK
ncbi:transcriptional regulator GcvA [Pseudomonas sp. H3(2019)]|nr:transcriptional regulator GcvA [Pseudomonas sp. H3(2019)]